MRIFCFSLLVFFGFALPVLAASTSSTSVTELAKVIVVENENRQQIPDTSVTTTVQNLRAEVLNGPDAGNTVSVENDYALLSVGDEFYMQESLSGSGSAIYSVSEPYRIPQLLILAGFFIVMVVVFGGWQGIRALVSLSASLFFIAYLLLPGILHGYSPVLVALGVSSLIIILGSYITHGFNRVTTSAVLGMIVTILVSGLIAYIAIGAMNFSGFSSDEAMDLNFYTAGSINFVGLLLAGVLIGLLGVLYDAAIGQAVAIDELTKVAPSATRFYIFRRALRIGREHIGALINTLAIAYVGVSLPLLLLFYSIPSGTSLTMTLNQEVFSTEIVRALIGGIGVVMAVPITTAIAVYLIHGRSTLK